MKIQNMVCSFFKCSFVLRIGVVIFELDKVTMSNFVKFEFWSMTLRIGRVFEKNTHNFESKTGQKGHEFSN